MKVVYITDTYETGGAYYEFWDMVNQLVKNHNDLIPVVLSSKYGSNNELADSLDIENYAISHKAFSVNNGSTLPRRFIRIIIRPFLWIQYNVCNLLALKKAEKEIDFSKVDIIHSNSNRNDIGAIIAKKYKLPHIWHIREYGLDCFSLRREYVHFMNSNSTSIIAVSKAVADHWIEKGIDREKVSVIYDGVCDNHNFVKTEGKIVRGIIVGFISPFKGQLELIRAISLLDEKYKKKFRLDIFGAGAKEYLLKINMFIKMNNLSECVRIMGYSENLNDIYPRYDVGFMCSKAEGFGRVTAEYMMNDICVVAADTGSNLELIDNGITGLLYRYNDLNDLKKKIEVVIDDDELRTNCAKEGNSRVKKFYTIKICADAIYDLYKGII